MNDKTMFHNFVVPVKFYAIFMLANSHKFCCPS
uniref:Uncharacterized protein n=1 Tax=Rhizophora mucronata TaxID=61149 RepID=A0A2P2QSY0_RHIMU